MYGITVYDDKLFEFNVTDDFVNSNKNKAKFIIPDMELDSISETYTINKNFFERVKEYISRHNQIPIYFLGDILNNPKGKAEDGEDICGEFLNWFSTLNNTHVIRGNGEMDLIDDGILNASPTKIDTENYKLTFGQGEYTHEIYLKKLQDETEGGMKQRIRNTLEKIYHESKLYEQISEKIILSHAPLLDYNDYYFSVTKNKKIKKRTYGDKRTHYTSIKKREKDYNDLRELFYTEGEIKYNIAGHIPIYDDWNIIKEGNKICILTNDEPYYERLKNGTFYANPGRVFNGTRKLFVLFDNVPPPRNRISVDDTPKYLDGIHQEIFSGGHSSKIMLYEYRENTFAKLLFYLFFTLVIILIVSLVTVKIYYKKQYAHKTV